MKNGILVWNILLTIAAGVLFFLYFGNKKAATAGAGKPAAANASENFRIAYFEMDSVENNFDMVKDVKAEISRKEEEYSNGLGRLDNTYRKRVQDYQAKGSQMTQQDYENAQIDLKRLEESLKSEKQRLDTEYQDFVTKRNVKVKKEIEDFIASFNKDKKYSYIVASDQGLFYYKDSVYDITPEVITGLNTKYKTVKKD
ncbi:MAG: OmpH family outer membrane protein [Chitinophagaceae bacterium]|nr:MAG: OmpH family outer membrane protein [Chitinophagaceae bacterium]